MIKRILFFAVALGLCAVGSASADDNVRAVQTKLRDGGFYSGEIDGAYSSELSAALSRYQTSNGLPITGQLDIDTSKALKATPAVRTDPAQSAETWRRLRNGERQPASKSDGETATSDEPHQERPEKASMTNRSSSSSVAEPETTARPESETVQSPRSLSNRQSVSKSDDAAATSEEPDQKRPQKALVTNSSSTAFEAEPGTNGLSETETAQSPHPVSKGVARVSSATGPETKVVPATEAVQSPRPISERVAGISSAPQPETQLAPETEAVQSPRRLFSHPLFKQATPVPSAAQPQTQLVPDTERQPSVAGAMPAPRVAPEPGKTASLPNLSKARLRDYVSAFVLAGLDPATEIEFFADHVTYYDNGVKDRAAIEKDLRSYKAHWPNRKFRLAGDIQIDRENDQRLRVTFPLSFELSNGQKRSVGKVEKSLILEPAGGDDLRIVAVTERGIQEVTTRPSAP